MGTIVNFQKVTKWFPSLTTGLIDGLVLYGEGERERESPSRGIFARGKEIRKRIFLGNYYSTVSTIYYIK